MKKTSHPLVGIIFLLSLLFTFAALTTTNAQEKKTKSANFLIPSQIKTLLDKSCTECHNSASEDEGAKRTLLVEEMANMEQSKLKAVLLEISLSVDNKMMPPRKYNKKNPGKVLTKDEIQQLADWAEDESDKLSGK